MPISNSCAFSDAYIAVKGTNTLTKTDGRDLFTQETGF